MILKRPYAFFIKNFKLFHLIIFALSSILLYRTLLLHSFMKEYVKATPNVIGKNLTSSLFSPWLYILITIIIIANIVIIYILIKKEKPYIYYILNITLYIGVLIMYIASNRVIHNLQEMLVAAKTTLAIRDITNLARLFQSVSVVFYLIRATGFDIKKFDFVRDLQGLGISEEDSEEIEVSLEFEKNLYVRNIKRVLRDKKYYYRENKFVINVIMVLTISALCLLVYLSANKYDKVYSENVFFNTGTLTMGIKESNITTKDYKNSTIVSDDSALVVLKVSAKSTKDTHLQLSRNVLVINNIKYQSSNVYEKSLVDLGNTYNNQKITSEFNDYILTYKIPKREINSKMIFKYIDNIEYKRGKTKINSIDVKLEPKNLDDKKEQQEQAQLNNEIQLDNYKINISNFELKDKFENIYNSCINQNECYDFKEILVPSVRETDKVILKLEGNFEYEESISNITNLYNFMEKYASIEYENNGTKHIETNDFKEITPTRTKQDNVFYIEVNKDMINAEKISLSFNLRNNTYTYILRGDTNE